MFFFIENFAGISPSADRNLYLLARLAPLADRRTVLMLYFLGTSRDLSILKVKSRENFKIIPLSLAYPAVAGQVPLREIFGEKIVKFAQRFLKTLCQSVCKFIF